MHKALTKGFFPLIMYSMIELQTPAGPVTGGVPAGAPFTFMEEYLFYHFKTKLVNYAARILQSPIQHMPSVYSVKLGISG